MAATKADLRHTPMGYRSEGVVTVLFFVAVVISPSATTDTLDTAAVAQVDSGGYILYCPCMGRFGNQADHLLGTLAFAKALNRTLVLPPWVEYRQGQAKSVQVPFKTYFDVEKLYEYHRVVPMEDFMTSLAPTVWPLNERVSFCYTFRKGPKQMSCNAKDGNPFGPFWDTFDIDFARSEVYGPLYYDVHQAGVAEEWSKKYPASTWPVLAFTGAPAAFPVQRENLGIQKYLRWNNGITSAAKKFIEDYLKHGAFVGIHLRNGVDWCVGYNNEFGTLTEEICSPSEEVIVKMLRKAVADASARQVFVASDSDHMLKIFNEHFRSSGIKFHRLTENNPHLDLAILGQSNVFIGNCVSSFSAFVKRERDLQGLKSMFWGFPPLGEIPSNNHDSGEL